MLYEKKPEWPVLCTGMNGQCWFGGVSPQAVKAFSLEEAPTFGRGSSLGWPEGFHMEEIKKTIVLVGRLDSKGNEYAFIRDRILAGGFKVIVVDSGSRGLPLFEADIPREEVARAAGVAMEKVVDRSDENLEIQVMMKGASEVVRGLYDSGRLDGIFCMGGSRGTAIGTAAMRALPFGIPKVMVSTIASGDMRPYVGTRDITVIHAVTDIFGLNRMTKRLLGYAAGAVMGAVASIQAGSTE